MERELIQLFEILLREEEKSHIIGDCTIFVIFCRLSILYVRATVLGSTGKCSIILYNRFVIVVFFNELHAKQFFTSDVV